MNRRLLMIFAFLVVCGLVLSVPTLIEALPDRYVMRFPEPLQKYGLPENDIALLPTVAPPVEAASLLSPRTAFTQATAVGESIPEMTPISVEKVPTSTPTPVLIVEATSTPTATSSPSPTATATLPPIPTSARLQGFQHIFQTWNNCGPATLAMALTYFGDQISQEQTASILKPNPEDRNVTPQEMVDYVNAQTNHRAMWRANGSPETIKRLIAAGMPVIIETGIEPPGEFRWLGWYGHYLLVVAYDDAQSNFWVYDSWFGTSEEPLQNAHPDGRELSYEALKQGWPQFNRNYIILFEESQSSALNDIIGEAQDDDRMWESGREQAISDIDKDPNNAFYWFNLGTNHVALGNYEEAAVAFDQARAIGLPWRMLWYQFGPFQAYLETQRLEDVVLLADVTLENRPYFEESFYYKGLALAGLGDHNAAIENLSQAARFNPNYRPAQEALAELGN